VPKLDRLTVKILRFMAPKGAEYFCSLSSSWDYQADVAIVDICRSVSASEPEVLEAVEYMVKRNLAGYRTLDSSAGPVHTAFYLKHEGLRWREIRRNERNSFLIKSVFVPVVVSVATSLLISVIGYLWVMSGITNLNASQTPNIDPMIEETIDTKRS